MVDSFSGVVVVVTLRTAAAILAYPPLGRPPQSWQVRFCAGGACALPLLQLTYCWLSSGKGLHSKRFFCLSELGEHRWQLTCLKITPFG